MDDESPEEPYFCDSNWLIEILYSMGTVLLLMGAGMVVGFFISGRHHILKAVDHLTNWSIYLLLFFLGISVGLNDKIIRNLETIGLQAFLLTLGAIGGSVLVVWLFYQWAFKPKK